MSSSFIASGVTRKVALVLAAAVIVALAISLGNVAESSAGGTQAVAAKKCKKGKKSAVAAKKCKNKKATPGPPAAKVPPLPDFCGDVGDPCNLSRLIQPRG